MRRQYVLDTSSLINDPFVYTQFPKSDVIIPIAVLNELDNLKKQASEAGRHARVCIKKLDEISCNQGDISLGILLDHDILLKIDAEYRDLSQFPNFGDPNYGDTQILACTYDHWKNHPFQNVCLISHDINLRVKAKSRGIEAFTPQNNNSIINDLYSGVQVIDDEEAGLSLQQQGYLLKNYNLNPNECVLFTNSQGDGIATGRQINDHKIKLIKKYFPWGISSRNKEQTFALDLIMDKNIDLVTLVGKAGVGKSIIALAGALELVLNKREYDKLVIYRPIQPVGNDIGFTPGTIQEKLEPWFQAIFDNFETLLNNKNSSDWRRDLEMFQKKGKVELSAITYIRGRSIPNSIIYLEEAQNLEKEEIKTILTRAGENTKIIITGDIEQIDNPRLDATNNGLTYVVEKFKSSNLAGHITFKQGERSRLATLAAEIL